MTTLQLIAFIIGEIPAVESLVVNGIEMFNTSWTAEQQLQALATAKTKLLKIDTAPPAA